MPRLLIRWLILTLTIMMIPHLISGVTVEGWGPAIAAAAILGVLNVLVKPLLVLLTLPLTVFSLGFFLLIINALVFQLAGSLVNGIHIDSFGSAFFAAFIVSIVSWVTSISTERQGGRRVIVVHGKDKIDQRPPIDLN